jgi:hypothetical protein
VVPEPTTWDAGLHRVAGGQVGHDVHRVGGDDQDGARRVGQDLGNHVLEDAGVAAQKLQARLAGAAADPCGDDDGPGAVQGLVAAGAHPHGIGERHGVQQVLGLGMRALLVHVDHDDLAAYAPHDHGIGGGRSDPSTADDSDFHGILLALWHRTG